MKTCLFLQVGNKADLADRREVEVGVAEEFARLHRIPYMETSVIGKENIKVRSNSIRGVWVNLANKVRCRVELWELETFLKMNTIPGFSTLTMHSRTGHPLK